MRTLLILLAWSLPAEAQLRLQHVEQPDDLLLYVTWVGRDGRAARGHHDFSVLVDGAESRPATSMRDQRPVTLAVVSVAPADLTPLRRWAPAVVERTGELSERVRAAVELLKAAPRGQRRLLVVLGGSPDGERKLWKHLGKVALEAGIVVDTLGSTDPRLLDLVDQSLGIARPGMDVAALAEEIDNQYVLRTRPIRAAQVVAVRAGGETSNTVSVTLARWTSSSTDH